MEHLIEGHDCLLKNAFLNGQLTPAQIAETQQNAIRRSSNTDRPISYLKVLRFFEIWSGGFTPFVVQVGTSWPASLSRLREAYVVNFLQRVMPELIANFQPVPIPAGSDEYTYFQRDRIAVKILRPFCANMRPTCQLARPRPAAA